MHLSVVSSLLTAIVKLVLFSLYMNDLSLLSFMKTVLLFLHRSEMDGSGKVTTKMNCIYDWLTQSCLFINLKRFHLISKIIHFNLHIFR